MRKIYVIFILCLFAEVMFGQERNIRFVKTTTGEMAMHGVDSTYVEPPMTRRINLEDALTGLVGLSTAKLQFRVDTTANAPTTGDSSLISASFINKHIEVFRGPSNSATNSGAFLQIQNTTGVPNITDGFRFNSTTGEVIFRPVFTTNEQVIIEVTSNDLWTDLGFTSSLTTGLVSYWKLNEAVGTGTADDIKDANDGTVTNAVQSNAGGKIGGSVTFDGVGDSIVMGNPANLQLTTVGTLSCWYYPTNLTDYHVIISKANYNTDRNGYLMYSVGTLFSGEVASASASQHYNHTTSSLNINQWNHCVFAWDADSIYLYLNGVKDKVLKTVVPVSNVKNFTIGTDPVQNTWGVVGKIDEVAVFSRKITDAEVAILFDLGNGLTYPFN